jgi:hypothetical protein
MRKIATTGFDRNSSFRWEKNLHIDNAAVD